MGGWGHVMHVMSFWLVNIMFHSWVPAMLNINSNTTNHHTRPITCFVSLRRIPPVLEFKIFTMAME
jgi:hypothetical protein